jgi:hypothetical protein
MMKSHSLHTPAMPHPHHPTLRAIIHGFHKLDLLIRCHWSHNELTVSAIKKQMARRIATVAWCPQVKNEQIASWRQ